MRYLTVFKAAERNEPPTAAEMEAMGQLIRDFTAEGKLITTEGCLPSRLGARVRRNGNAVTVTDGPFTEAKEAIGGFAIIEAADMNEAVALTKRFLAVAGDGESEIRQLYEVPAMELHSGS